MENDAEALHYYTQVVQDHPNSPNVRQSMLQVALIHKRQGNADQALDEFKAIVRKYPTMDGARDALAGIESIYVEQGRVGDYETYLRSLSFVDPDSLDLDEKYYRSAEALYFDNKCDKAIGAFGDYLNKYPNGGYALNALYYRGDCEYRAQQYDKALPDLEAVIERNGQEFLGIRPVRGQRHPLQGQALGRGAGLFRATGDRGQPSPERFWPPKWGRCAACANLAGTTRPPWPRGKCSRMSPPPVT